MTNKQRITVMVGGIAAGLAGLLYVLISDSHGKNPRPEDTTADDGSPSEHARATNSAKRSDGIQARPTDPANYIAAEHAVDPKRVSEFRVEADEAEDLRAALARGESQWEPTLIDLDFSEHALSTYIECSTTHLRKPCKYDIDYVIEVKEPGSAEVAFGRVAMEQAYAEDCEQYVKCLVQGNVGASVVVAPDINGVFSHRKSQIDNNPDVTLEQLEQMLALMEEGVAMMEEKGPDGEPDWEYRLELERSYITLIKMRIAAMTSGG